MSEAAEKLIEDMARAIYASYGFDYEGRTINANGEPYGEWARAVQAAHRSAAVAFPAIREMCAAKAEEWDQRNCYRGDFADRIRALSLDALPATATELVERWLADPQLKATLRAHADASRELRSAAPAPVEPTGWTEKVCLLCGDKTRRPATATENTDV